jgi:hypothetical protein
LGLSVISLVSASQPRIEVRILIYRKRPIKLEQPDPQQIHHLDQAFSLIVDNLNELLRIKQIFAFVWTHTRMDSTPCYYNNVDHPCYY